MCNFKNVIKQMTKIKDTLSDADKKVSISAVRWIRLTLVPLMNETELEEFSHEVTYLLSEIKSNMSRRKQQGGIQ